MIRVALNPAQRAEVRARPRAAGITPRPRDRLEMIRLADAGGTIPGIARRLGSHEQTVRRQVTVFLAGGFAALPGRPRPGRPPRVTAGHLEALEARLETGGRTWTTAQLAAWLERAHGVPPDHLRVVLPRRRFGWKRTVTSGAHQRRDPDGDAAKVSELAERKKRPKTA